MPAPSIYISLEDDVSKIVQRLQRQTSPEVVLVCPRRCLLFSDAINLRLLKKQTDLLGKRVFVMTMDEHGQQYAREAGFGLKSLPKSSGGGVSDIGPRPASLSGSQDRDFAATALPGKSPPKTLLQPHQAVRSPAKKPIPPVVRANTPPTHPEPVQPPLEVSDVYFPPEVEEAAASSRHQAFNQKMITSLTAICLIVLLLLVFVILPKATVAVYPKTEAITRDMDISLSAAASSSDVTQLILPATQINQTLEVNNTFQSQGKQQVGNKATGFVQIYNFTKQPITLKADTTTISLDGKNYSLNQDVVLLKPTSYSNVYTKQVNAASLGQPVAITAAVGGDDYNVPAGVRMEISNQVFGSKPQLLYAQTSTAIDGGTTRYLSLISADDVTAAQASLNTQLIQTLRSSIQQKGLALADGAYSVQPVSFGTDNPVGTQTPDFSASLTATVMGLAVNQNDLQSLVSSRIKQTLPQDQTLLASANNLGDYQIENLDLNNGTALLSLNFQGQAELDINLNNAAAELVGKSRQQANEILSSSGQVQRVDITLAPSWQSFLPFFASKIHVYLAPPGNASSTAD